MNTQNAKTVNPFIIFVFFIAAVIVALPLRVFQLMVNVESGTGFWINHTHFSIYVLYAILAIGTVLPLVLSLVFKSGLGKVEPVVGKKIFGGVVSLLMSGALIVDAVVRYMSFSNLYVDTKLNVIASEVMSNLSKSGAIAMVVEAFFAVVSAIFFIMLGISWLTGKDPSEFKLLAVMPVFWTIFRIMHRFMRKISFLNVSELFFELLMIVFLMMFFMAFAQVTAKVNGKGLEWKLYAYGLPAALFCLICFVPRIVLFALGKDDLIASASAIEPVDLMRTLLYWIDIIDPVNIISALFILFVLIDRSRVFRKERKQKGLPE